MEERLKRLLALRAKAGEELDKLVAERQAILDVQKDEAREDFTPEEDVEFRSKSAQIKAKQTECAGLDERIQELAEEIERSGRLSEGATAVRKAQARVEAVREAAAYEKGSKRSYFLDLARAQTGQDDNGESAERLRRHAKDVATGSEYRDMDRTDGNGGYFVPPAWLMEQFIKKARAGRPYANLATSQPLPPKTDSIKIPKITSGLSVAFQTADNAAVTEADIDDAAVTVDVKTIAGQTSAALQLLEQSAVNFDEVIFDDLMADHATKVDIAVLRGTGSNGQVKGVHNTPGITTVAVSAVTVAGFYKALADGIQRVHTSRFQAPTHIVMHPRRWAWLTSQLDGDTRPLVLPAANSPQNALATLDAVAAEQVVGQLQGLPVVTDASIGTTYGGSSNEDLTYVQRSSDQYLYEGERRTRVLPEVKGQNLTVVLQLYSYIAFTAERYPESVVEITGMTAPTF